jgi:hypothetical protein
VSTQSISEEAYAQTVGDEFIRMRGRGFALSPFDLELITKWYEDGVPLHVPIATMADLVHWLELRKLRIRGLAFIREEVEARFSEWREGRVGAHE